MNNYDNILVVFKKYLNNFFRTVQNNITCKARTSKKSIFCIKFRLTKKEITI